MIEQEIQTWQEVVFKFKIDLSKFDAQNKEAKKLGIELDLNHGIK
jgi:hypothetical protein